MINNNIKYFIHKDIFKYNLTMNDLIAFKNSIMNLYIPKYLYKGYTIINNKLNLIGIDENEFISLNKDENIEYI